jgi:hypothetical protein
LGTYVPDLSNAKRVPFRHILLFSNLEQKYLLQQVVGIQRVLLELNVPISCLHLYLGDDIAARSNRIRAILSNSLDVYVDIIPSTVMQLAPPAPFCFLVLVDNDEVVRYQSSMFNPCAIREILESNE